MYDKFVEILQKKGLTVYRVSKETGISQTTFSNWKSGRSNPKSDTMKKIADYLGVTVDYLMNENELSEKEDITDNGIYYLNDEARDMANFLFENPDYKVLFDASRKVKKEDIEFVKQMIDRMSGRDKNDDFGC